VYPATGSLLAASPFPPAGSRRARFPRYQRYYEGATTSHPRINDHLFDSLPPPTLSSLLRVSPQRSWEIGGLFQAGFFCLYRQTCSGFSTWTRMGSLRSPGDPSRASAPLLDPGRTDVASPSRSHRCCPRFAHNEGFGNWHFGAHSRSFGTRWPTLRVSCCHSRARLASGWLAGLCREGVVPSGPLREVSARVHVHPPLLSSWR